MELSDEKNKNSAACRTVESIAATSAKAMVKRMSWKTLNVWNADLGDIAVGKRCWLSLNSVIMGLIEIADEVSPGPYV